MHNVKILDCTLRDGGYYNNWDFSTNLAKSYLNTLSKTSVDVIEIGFRKPITNIGSGPSGLKKIGKFLTSDEKFLSKLNIPKNKEVSVMIDLADYVGHEGYQKLKKNFGKSQRSVVSIVRIACNYSDKKKLGKVIKYLKTKKYTVCANLMKFTILKNSEILSFFKFALKSGANYLYLADSFGNCLPNDIKNISKFLKKELDIKLLGFHSHDNMGNALNNTIAAINEGFGIIDTSIMGMGRGAGNLKLESFLNYKKSTLDKKKINVFSKNYMYALQKKYNWGKNKYYEYSAKNNIHPTFVQRFLEEEKFKKKHIFKILQFLKKNKATQYDMNIFDNLFLKTNTYKKTKLLKNNKIAILCDSPESKKIDLRYLKGKGYIISSLNYINFINSNCLDFIFICNAYRVFTEIEEAIKIKNTKLIIPNYKILKNVLKTNKKKIVNYNFLKNKDIKIKKDLCMYQKNLVLVYALSFCISCQFKEIVIFGLTKNISNYKILNEINGLIKRKNYKSKIIIK